MTTLLSASLVVALLYLGVLVGLAVFFGIRAGGRRDDLADHFGALSQSRFTIPVSLIVPADGQLACLDGALSSLLALNYPELEIVVVADASTDPVFARIRAAWQLEPNEFFYRQSIGTAVVRRIYRSNRDARITFVDKHRAGKADALNCGTNLARYRYVASIAPGIEFGPTALMQLMTAPLRDPATVVGASSHVECLSLFDRLAGARSLMVSRLLWRRLGHGVPPLSSVCVWRRDAILDTRGFSTTVGDAEVDMARRAVVVARASNPSARFYRGSEIFGSSAPQPLYQMLAAIGRRQLGIVRWLMTFTSSVRGLGGLSLLAMLAIDILLPLAQIWLVLGTAWAAVTGVVPWTVWWVTLAGLAFGSAMLSTAALLMRGALAGAPEEGELSRLIAIGPIEPLLVRPAAVVAGVFGLLSR